MIPQTLDEEIEKNLVTHGYRFKPYTNASGKPKKLKCRVKRNK
jgi:hypothetical protein